MADRSKISNLILTQLLSHLPALFCCLITCCLLPPTLIAQQLQRSAVLPVKSDTLRIDTLSMIPGSWSVGLKNNQPMADSLYRIDWIRSLLIFKTGSTKPDSIAIRYQVYPLDLDKTYQHKTLTYNRINPPVYKPRLESGDGYNRSSDGALQSSGSLSRGVSLGNTRDASLTSNLNLQLEGKLNKDYRIEATLSDANIPVQPEGNTQQIQDFDKVFMRIYNAKNEILAGDFDIKPLGGYFLQMNKRVQGARFTTESKAKSGNSSFLTRTGAAVVKGKYNRNTIQGSEGNQGPYLLTGANGENYIQIIAGSEKIYLDGQLLTRGENADYTIDYNSAEIHFTPKILMTGNKRITAEFEYSERSYSRFLLYNENHWKTQKGSWFLNVYSENDAKNQPLLQDLTDSNKQLLSSIGDHTERSQISAITESAFVTDRVLYKMTDTLVNGIRYDSILIQSFNSDSAKYQAGFSYVGAGKGNYIAAPSTANGRVFKWVAPVNSTPQGSYEPVTRLVMPQSKQVFSAGTRQKMGSRMEMEMEWALTRNDQNTFSSLDDDNNVGLGMKTRLSRNDLLNKDSSLILQSFIDYRYTGAQFDPVERFREVEFERDWNLTASDENTQENYLASGFNLKGKDSLQASYRLEYLNLQSAFDGLRQYTTGRLRRHHWDASWSGSYLLSSDVYRRTAFLRHNAQISREIGKVYLKWSEDAENNRWRNPGNDTLLSNSQAYQEFSFETAKKVGERQPWMVKVSTRSDQLPQAGTMVSSSRSWDAESWFDISKKPAFPFKAGFHVRSLEVDSISQSTEETGKTLTGRIENRWQAWKGLLRSQTFFEMGSGFDRKMEYSYLEVAAGQGYYTWKDYNGNNIKELNEFESAYFQDQATFIRVSRLGTEYTPTLVNKFNQVLTLQPKKGFLSKFTSQLAYRIDKKTPRGDYGFLVNPFTGNPQDQRLINLSSQLRHDLSFNKSGTRFSANLVTQKQSTRITLVNGADGKVNWSNSLFIRYRFHPAWQLNSTSDWSQKQSISEYFASKNYTLASLSQLLQMECQVGTGFRIGVDWEYRSESNKTDGSQLSSNRLESVLTAQIPEKGQISLSAQYVYIDFNGDADSPAGYAMMKGFGKGHNAVIQLSARYKLGKNLVLEGTYEGRIAEGGKMVHNAQLQVRALF